MKSTTINRTGRRLVPVAALVTGALLFASPAGAACAVTVSRYDDGVANTSLDVDYGDDTARKTFYSPSTRYFATGMDVVFSGSAYGGCGNYRILVNGASDHTFNTCTAGWQQQQLTSSFATTVLTVEVQDIDGTWNTGIYFDVDTNYSGHSTMAANYTSVSGELMWTIGAACT